MTECQSKLDLILPSKTDWIFWAKNRHKKCRVAWARSVSVSVSRSCVLCLWRHGAGCVPAPSPVRPPLACLFSVKSLRRRAVTVSAQETGQGGTAGSAQSLVPVRGEGEGAGREETVRTLGTARARAAQLSLAARPAGPAADCPGLLRAVCQPS